MSVFEGTRVDHWEKLLALPRTAQNSNHIPEGGVQTLELWQHGAMTTFLTPSCPSPRFLRPCCYPIEHISLLSSEELQPPLCRSSACSALLPTKPRCFCFSLYFLSSRPFPIFTVLLWMCSSTFMFLHCAQPCTQWSRWGPREQSLPSPSWQCWGCCTLGYSWLSWLPGHSDDLGLTCC